MFTDRKTQYFQDVGSFQLDLWFNAILIKILASYFVNFKKIDSKIYWRGKRTVNKIVKNKNKI